VRQRQLLYATLALVKDVELEVLRAREALTGQATLRIEEVDPGQFYGLEKDVWAREIAELTLWIGFHQFWKRHHAVQPPEPVLRDTGTLAHRDAVLAWTAVRHDPARDRPTRPRALGHPVTGELVPDPGARLRLRRYEGAARRPGPRPTSSSATRPTWGKMRQRELFGDGLRRRAPRAVPRGAGQRRLRDLLVAPRGPGGRLGPDHPRGAITRARSRRPRTGR
jgi:hypothetical protein